MRPISTFVNSTIRGERSKYMTTTPPPDLIRLDTGSPSFATPAHICDALKRAVDAGHTGYIMEKGVAALQTAICETVASETGVTYAPDQVLVTHGASSGIYAVMTCFTNPGDEVILFNPSYSLFAHVAKQVGAVPVYASHNAQYQLDVEAVRAVITPRTRLIFLNNPNNPTGMVYRRHDIAALLDLCAEKDLLLVSDEAYCKLLQPGEVHVPILSFAAHRERVILLGSFSKSHAMTGWRLGYLIAPPDLINILYGTHRAITGPVCNFVQHAGIAALRGPQDCIAEFNRVYERRAALMRKLALAIPGLQPTQPQGTFYLWCRYDLPLPAAQLHARIWERGVAVRTGSEFGSDGEQHIRLSYSMDEAEIEKGMAVVAAVFSELRGD